MRRLRWAVRATLLLGVAASVLAGCDEQPAPGHNDVVFAKEKREWHGLHTYTYHLCVGGSRDSCEWKQLLGKRKRVRYNRCQIGEHYPDCLRGN